MCSRENRGCHGSEGSSCHRSEGSVTCHEVTAAAPDVTPVVVLSPQCPAQVCQAPAQVCQAPAQVCQQQQQQIKQPVQWPPQQK